MSEAKPEHTLRETNPGRYEDTYIGDGAYVYIAPDRAVVIYTSNGITETNRVVLEPEVLALFEKWVGACRARGL